MAGMYRNTILSFIEGVPWDTDENDVRDMAISCAGEYLRGSPKDPKMYNSLRRIVDDDEEDDSTREWALRSIARALGLSHSDLQGSGTGLPLGSKLGKTVLSALQRDSHGEI